MTTRCRAASSLKPLVGVENDGPGDACIATPVLGSRKGVIVANGINPKYSEIDAYHSAAAAIDEALRNVIAVGGTLEKTALLDNFCWGNPDKPDRLGRISPRGESVLRHRYCLRHAFHLRQGQSL